MIRLSGVVVALALLAAGPAVAEERTAIDPAKLALAKQLIDLGGGGKNAELMIRQSYAAVGQAFDKVGTPENRQVMRAVQREFEDEMVKMVPTLIEQSIEIYARNLTTKELTDMVAWQSSETGRSVTAKMPIIIRESTAAQIPLLRELFPRMLQRTIDRACVEAKCSPAQRQEVAEAVQRAMQSNAS